MTDIFFKQVKRAGRHFGFFKRAGVTKRGQGAAPSKRSLGKTLSKTSNDVRGRNLGSEESTREEVGRGGNEDVKMDEWIQPAGQN